MDQHFKEKFLVCSDCGEEFIFTASAQEYFAERGYTDDPKRCRTCCLRLRRGRGDRGFDDTQPVAVDK